MKALLAILMFFACGQSVARDMVTFELPDEDGYVVVLGDLSQNSAGKWIGTGYRGKPCKEEGIEFVEWKRNDAEGVFEIYRDNFPVRRVGIDQMRMDIIKSGMNVCGEPSSYEDSQPDDETQEAPIEIA